MTASSHLPAADRAHLVRAIALAERSRGRTSPNPPVGCVLARGQERVGEGATEPAGGRHAEVVALDAAGEAARGTTAYVTLEPCAHHGRTPPCTDALLSAGVRRVVYALHDPNVLARGGAQVLRRAGAEVVGPEAVGPFLAGAVACQLEGFLRTVQAGRPHVTLKLAQTVDGRLVPPDGRRWVTGPAARRAVHRLRAASDAVLVGSGTVLADDPRLDARDVAVPRQPRPVVLDARLRTPPSANVARPRAVVVTSPAAPPGRRRELVDRGVEVVEVDANAGGGVDLVAAMRQLAARGVTSLLAEPGPTLAGALVAAALVDRLVLHVAATSVDDRSAWAIPAAGGSAWDVERVGGAGADAILHLVPAGVRSTAPTERAA